MARHGLTGGLAIAALAVAAAGLVRPAAAAPVPKGPGSLAGLWENADYKGTGQFSARDRAIHTTDGKTPPLLPAVASTLTQRVDDSDKNGNVFANTISQCLPGGVPEMDFGATYPIQILETPGQVTMLFDEQNHFRVIPLDVAHQKDPDPSYMGDSVGHWDGDTLVVDTIGLNDKTTLDMVGTPHTEALHVVERFHRISPDRMEVLVHMEDAGAFSKPWDTKVTYRMSRPGTLMTEYICENNRNTTDSHGFTSFGPGK